MPGDKSVASAKGAFPQYIGRFAPSPTGPLHFGSLVSALASYLDALTHQGRWLLRIEDIDPPRQQPGAIDSILTCLDAHGLHWDGPVVYQSQRLDSYQAQLDSLLMAGLVYPCNCSRQRLHALGGIYDGYCRSRIIDSSQPYALRLKLSALPNQPDCEAIHFIDLIQGLQHQTLGVHAGDQVLKRRDGLFAYQLAVVVDDIAQHITHIIRGSDLLEVTGRQIFFYQLLGATPPKFGHVPLAIQANGQKLSKQNRAPPLNNHQSGINVWQALAFLGQNPPQDLYAAAPAQLLSWAIQHWKLTQIRGLTQLYND